METAFLAEPVLMKSLRRKLGNADNIWSEIEGLYDHLHTMTDEDQAEQDRVTFTAFQDCYTKLHGRVEDALEKERREEEARDQARLKAIKLQQLSAK